MQAVLECPICDEVFSRVVEVSCCSQLYCSECVLQWIERSGTCPSCRQEITATDLRPNVPFQRMIDNLPAECPNKEKGCQDKLTRGLVSQHEEKCGYGEVQCLFEQQRLNRLAALLEFLEKSASGGSKRKPKVEDEADFSSTGTVTTASEEKGKEKEVDKEEILSDSAAATKNFPYLQEVPLSPELIERYGLGNLGRKVSGKRKDHEAEGEDRNKRAEGEDAISPVCGYLLRKDMEDHKKDCPWRPVLCHVCGDNTVPSGDLELHKSRECSGRPIQCGRCKSALDSIGHAKDHEGNCPAVPVPCPYARFGCTQEVLLRGNLEEHMHASIMKHAELACASADKHEGTIQRLLDTVRHLQKVEESARAAMDQFKSLVPKLSHSPLKDHILPLVLPSKLVNNSGRFPEVALSVNGTRVTFGGRTHGSSFFVNFPVQRDRTNKKAVMVRADEALPSFLQDGMYYFEVTVIHPGKNGAIGIGLCSMTHELIGMPGWTKDSYGYHADDGKKFEEESGGIGYKYGETWCKKGDTAGMAYFPRYQYVVFTCGQRIQGVAFQNISLHGPAKLAPVIGLHSEGAQVKVNFGQRPFVFEDLEQLEAWTLAKAIAEGVDTSPSSVGDSSGGSVTADHVDVLSTDKTTSYFSLI